MTGFFFKRMFNACVVAPTRHNRTIRRMVEYVERNSRPTKSGLIDLPGHRKYASLPGHTIDYASAYYAAMRRIFLDDPDSSVADRAVREELVCRLERIDAETDIKSTPVEGLYLAAATLALRCEGDVVECGCYAGGSTAKLSIVAKLTGRKLYVFDSFEGLPEPEQGEAMDYHARRTTKHDHSWGRGEYSAALETVRDTVTRYGEIDCCQFVKGWFSDTLDANLPSKVALAFVDVDLASSAHDCLRSIWPRMPKAAVFFTHDAAYVKVLQAFYDSRLWAEEWKELPPILWGAGFGMGDAAAHLGFAVKGNCEAEYVKSLMFWK